jgi:hypothetical protein
MPDYIAKPDTDFAAQMTALIAVLAANEAAYGMAAGAAAPLSAALDTFDTALGTANTAKAAANVAVAAKDQARNDLEGLVRPLIRQIQENPIVTDALRSDAGIPIRDTVRTTSSPVAPSDLVATADAAGTNSLRWSGAGNASGIQFVIEAKVGSAPEFSIIDVVTATSYRHTDRVPGQAVLYRVKARRGSMTSDPSNIAGVYQA